jgi:hypothetical protein
MSHVRRQLTRRPPRCGRGSGGRTPWLPPHPYPLTWLLPLPPPPLQMEPWGKGHCFGRGTGGGGRRIRRGDRGGGIEADCVRTLMLPTGWSSCRSASTGTVECGHRTRCPGRDSCQDTRARRQTRSSTPTKSVSAGLTRHSVSCTATGRLLCNRRLYAPQGLAEIGSGSVCLVDKEESRRCLWV